MLKAICEEFILFAVISRNDIFTGPTYILRSFYSNIINTINRQQYIYRYTHTCV